MPKAPKIPSYRHHKPSGRAVVTLGNQTVYLGKYNSAESKREYHRLIAEWTASNGIAPKATSDFTVAELLAAFVRYANGYHTGHEQEQFLLAMKPPQGTVRSQAGEGVRPAGAEGGSGDHDRRRPGTRHGQQAN